MLHPRTIMQKLLLLNKLIIAVLILASNINTAYSQINLVPNPSFETLTGCPNNHSQIDSVLNWGTLISGGGSTPDLFAACCISQSVCGVPSNFYFNCFQQPRTGDNYVGIYVAGSIYPNIFREYIQCKLQQKLKINHFYCVKFYCNLFNLQHAYIITLGAYFDNGNISSTQPYGLPNVSPQIFSNQSLFDTLNWMKIEGSFIALGTEEYISIGNFFPDSLSGITIINSPAGWDSYYYIDDVSVIDANLPAYAGNDTLIQPGDSVFIGRQPEIGLDEDCIWFVNGVPIDTVAGLWVQPDSTTTFIVQQTICGNVSWDTVTVSVDTGVGIEGVTNGLTRWFRVYPNPATHQLTIECPVTNATLSITNLLGQEVLRQEVAEKNFSIDISKLGRGVYFVRVEGRNGFVVKKFLKE